MATAHPRAAVGTLTGKSLLNTLGESENGLDPKQVVEVQGVMTHYVEGGTGPTLVLLHSGEFGGCAEITWEFNIQELARRFHVYAPDWLGFGKTEKFFSFEDMWGKRVDHITGFLKAVGITRAHFAGNSMGGTMLLTVATMVPCPWPIERMVIVSGGGSIPDNAARQLLNDYDCTRGLYAPDCPRRIHQ